MQLTTIALVISIIGLVMSFFLVGILPSVLSLIMGIIFFIREEEKTIGTVRIIAISAVGVLLPLVMYFNTFGLSLPQNDPSGVSALQKILSTNYSNLGIDIFDPKEMVAEDLTDKNIAAVSAEADIDKTVDITEKEQFSDDDSKEKEKNLLPDKGKDRENSTSASDVLTMKESIFESLDSIDPKEKNKGGIVSIAASDDDMPSYGGLPVGTMLIAQYFRQDDHNCNPVLVLQNKTGDLCRYECRFIARDPEGEEIAVSDKTVEVVRDGAVFVFEGRFDKRDLGGKVPDAYEFSITKRTPYEADMANQISIRTSIDGTRALITAENRSDKKVKVDAYVLFFDENELVDCMWMIPQNTDEVCLEPGSSATIAGDAYYRFNRVETFYTAYEAVGQG